VRTLNETVLELYRDLWDDLEDIFTEPDLAQRHEDAARAVLVRMRRLAEIVREHKFADEPEEIAFFKCLKPMFTSLLVFHNLLYLLYLHWPPTQKEQEEHVQRMILDLVRIFHRDKKEFVRYSRSGSVHNDRYGYLRSQYDALLNFHPEDACNDLTFCTNFDQLQGVLLAYDDLVQYCLDGRVYGNAPAQTEKREEAIHWQRAKADWGTLIDGLALVKAFGEMTAQEIHDTFSLIVGVKADLPGSRRDRRMQKKQKPNILQEMVEALRRFDAEPD
jgi:hypothetical protein